MDIERLRKIMEYSNSHRDEIALKVRKFYAFSDMSSDTEVINIMQIARDFENLFSKSQYASDSVDAYVCHYGKGI